MWKLRKAVRTPVLAVLVSVLAVGGCTGDVEPTGPAPTTGSAAPDPAVSTTPAQVGDDVAACGDAACRIWLSAETAVPLDAAFDIEELLLAHVAPNQVTFDVGSQRGDLHGYITGTGYIGLAYGVTITVESVDSTGALVRIEPETADPQRHKGSGTEGFLIDSGRA